MTFIQWATWVCAAQATIFFRLGPCFLVNACSEANGIEPLLRHSSMNAMLLVRMRRTVSRHSGVIAVASRPSSADCMRLRKASIGARQDWLAGLSMYGPTTWVSAMLL